MKVILIYQTQIIYLCNSFKIYGYINVLELLLEYKKKKNI